MPTSQVEQDAPFHSYPFPQSKVGVRVGSEVGGSLTDVGAGETVGIRLGADVGVAVGVRLGRGVVGSGLGTDVGAGVGGDVVGSGLGMAVGSCDSVGAGEGLPKIAPSEV